eukprot:CAMPEP_0180705082 /NCGR_PEP_ID=MMETSP1038_2-20121128/7490_1 /TAXON_ID=632150 /ORGANISM="Azadinium spinosum, Strain 3D9" /LENGTH=395 /DNA_ID=CAMNT_0022736939 /DNA_START=76 /DNA_END=1260 /DNA_ORIENTATION=+
MAERDLTEAVEVIQDRLYWVALRGEPVASDKVHYFSVDSELVYEPFFADFGPLNLAMTYRYCKKLEGYLKDPLLEGKHIIHYCSQDPPKRSNAAYLMAAYQVIVMGKTSEMAFKAFRAVYPPFMPFRDASCGICTFRLTIQDCLKGLEDAIRHRWFDYAEFDVESYEYYEKIEHGDMNWILPGKFLAFAGPSANPTSVDGFQLSTPEDYADKFRDAGIGLIVRLNDKQYDRRRFTDHGFRHVDLYFMDGSCPPEDIMSKFMHICENEQGGIAVHCKAGLGRTGTLIGLYVMKHYHISARSFIGWNRICRPGSILGPQQQFLVSKEQDMIQAGALALAQQHRVPASALPPLRTAALTLQVEKLSLQERNKEDVGQGDRLCNAKRYVRRSPSGAASP